MQHLSSTNVDRIHGLEALDAPTFAGGMVARIDEIRAIVRGDADARTLCQTTLRAIEEGEPLPEHCRFAAGETDYRGLFYSLCDECETGSVD